MPRTGATCRRTPEAQEQRLDEIPAVECQRHRLAETRILHQVAEHRVGRRVVEEENQRLVEPVLGQQNVEVALVLVFDVQRIVAQLDEVASLHVQFTGENLQRQHLRILGRGLANVVDVGELIARRVDLEIVGVALEQVFAGADNLAHLPRVHYRELQGLHHTHHVGAVPAHQAGPGFQHEARPLVVAEALFLHDRNDVFDVVVVAMELLQVVGRLHGPSHATATVGMENHLQQPVRRREVEAEGVIVHRLELGRLIPAHQPHRVVGVEFLVLHDVLEEEPDILGGDPFPVRPLQAAPQREGPGGAVVADRPILVHPGTYSGRFLVRLPPETHRQLAIKAAEEGVSLNRLVSTRLAR